MTRLNKLPEIDSALEFQVRECLKRRFLQFAKDHNIPVHVTPVLLDKGLTKRAATEILPNLKELVSFKQRYFRYDLSLGLIGKSIWRRVEVGTVYRGGPKGRYRWRVFEQGDIDFLYSPQQQAVFLNLYSRIVSLLIPRAEIVYNDLGVLQRVVGPLSRRNWAAIDAGAACVNPAVLNALLTEGPTVPPDWKPLASLVRGLHMYRGLVFEVRVPDLSASLGGGGHYVLDKQYIGGSLGIFRIARYIVDTRRYLVVYYTLPYLLLFKTAIERQYPYVVYRLITEAIGTIFYKALNQGVRNLVFIGAREALTKELTIKNIPDRTCKTLYLLEGMLHDTKP